MANNTTIDQVSDKARSAVDESRSMFQRAQESAREFVRPQDGVSEGERSEGTITKQIESVTSKVPSGTFLSLAIASMGVSALLQVSGFKKEANFVGQWVPTILIMGLYNKLVKLEGSER